MGFGLILSVIILIFDILISVWNAYNAGKSLEIMKIENINEDWPRMVAYSALVLSFAGATYGNLGILSLIAYYLGYINYYTLASLLSFSFLVFGFLIILFGLVITVNSIIVAYKTKGFWNIAIAIYNSIATIWDIYTYIQGFSYALNTVKGLFSSEDRNSQGIFIVLIIVAALIAIFLVYGAYKHGRASAYKIKTHISLPSPVES
jgi:ABC-type multidrug transport system permease subunit